ncbi:MAG: hypothetical protein HC802_16940 [Caldilineaceae bacterium]|nr:hypothetical protein [Caldilineaceae bacterium]
MFTRRIKRVQSSVGRLQKTQSGSKLVTSTQQAANAAGQAITSEEAMQAAAGAGASTVAVTQSASQSASSTASQAVNKVFALGVLAKNQVNGQMYAMSGANNGKTGKRDFVYVPVLEPGQNTFIDVRVTPVERPIKATDFDFRVISRPLDQDDLPPLIEQGSIQIPGASWARRYARLLTIVAIVSLLLILFFIYQSGLFSL